MIRSLFVACVMLAACEHAKTATADPHTTSAGGIVDAGAARACTLSYTCGMSHPGLGSSSDTTSVDFATCKKTRSSFRGPFEAPMLRPGETSDASTSTSSTTAISRADCDKLVDMTAAITSDDLRRAQESAQIDTTACTLTLLCASDPNHYAFQVQRQSLGGGLAVVKLIHALQSGP